ncbi:restriction endonuclease [Mycobacterium sp.]|uniref:restriction endonuclease n=1 Tax=Mycobacterium sp. TaxID=1785 RepID=UPI002D799607|nr:restriction endonuclease [Mycobacterium sp.]
MGAFLGCAAGTATLLETHSMWAAMTVGAAVLGGWAALPLWVKARRLARYLRSGLREIDAMTGMDFENYVAARLRAAGYRVALTKVTGDFGVDLIASKGNERIAIQCKRHGRRVGTAAVQQVVAGALLHRCTSTMVVSNQEFTHAATRLAEAHACELVGRRRLPKWLRRFGDAAPATRKGRHCRV